MFVFYDQHLEQKMCVISKPVIKGHHMYHVYCDLITMPRYHMKKTNLFLW